MPTSSSYYCANGYVHPPGSPSCYRAEGVGSFGWTASNGQCTNGGKLATFATAADAAYVVGSFCGVTTTQAAMWIGLYDPQGATGYGSPARHKWAWSGSTTPLTAAQLAVFASYWGAGGATANADAHHSCVQVLKSGGVGYLQAGDCTGVLGPLRCCQIAAT